MFSSSSFRELVSGRKTGLAAAALRGLLKIIELPYGWAVRLRNRRYDDRRAEIHHVDVPVICVGNLTLGGTGKTPMVEWIARQLQEAEVRSVIVSRGYRAAEGDLNDEALELELALPGVPHLQNPDRVAGAQAAIAKFGAQSILMDDGFQHRRLARDLDIVLLDATEPFGFEHLFPRGTLREPIEGLSRAQAVVLSRADMLDSPSRDAVRQRVKQLAPEAAWCEVVHRPQTLLSANGAETPLSSLADQRVAAFCGIGNPAGFRHTLDTLGCEVVAWREFPDHHRYTEDDIQSLAQWAGGIEWVVCTRKDLVKLRDANLGNRRLLALNIRLNFLTGEEALASLVKELFPNLTKEKTQ